MTRSEFVELAESIQQWSGTMRDSAEQLPEHLAQLCARTVAEWDTGRHVQATARFDGRLVGLLIGPYARRDLSPERLSAACLEAASAARDSAQRLLAEGLHELADVRAAEARA
ncbi:hypothetical protein KZZ52_33085 [Dactylosporangium sp. AC04546]|uniref:hypothetical protein n=1 Tax=Dactylosporangium sp. AC04546 TaxID=2862460 RepID=UPI001EDF61B4|nr:hypothetical protein [Dactylosporangium sp. AC04546]WVK78820.1 hypothetical protein KZZ52_33085 [Dactylosporangium sp. AC04546]